MTSPAAEKRVRTCLISVSPRSGPMFVEPREPSVSTPPVSRRLPSSLVHSINLHTALGLKWATR